MTVEQEEFIKYLNAWLYIYVIDNGNINITGVLMSSYTKYKSDHVGIAIATPEGVRFTNKGDVEIYDINLIHETTLFDNSGSVHIID